MRCYLGNQIGGSHRQIAATSAREWRSAPPRFRCFPLNFDERSPQASELPSFSREKQRRETAEKQRKNSGKTAEYQRHNNELLGHFFATQFPGASTLSRPTHPHG